MADLTFQRRQLSSDEASFSLTSEFMAECSSLPVVDRIIGQPRAMRALEMGLSIPGKGYNIYVSGEPGTGRYAAIRCMHELHAQNLPHVRDIAYVHNFPKPDSPVVLTFDAGNGRAFLLAAKEFIQSLKDGLVHLVQSQTPCTAESLAALADPLLATLKSSTSEPLAHSHVERMRKDIMEQIRLFSRMDEADIEHSPVFQRYAVNLLVDHGDTSRRPLVFESHPTFANLFGSLDSDCSTRDESYTPFLSIHAGSLLQAAGGILVMNAEELLIQEGLWEALKRFLTSGELVIQNPHAGSSHASGVRPQPVSLSLKIILVGSEDSYDAFCEHDVDFLKLFKISAEFDYRMPATRENIAGTIAFIRRLCIEEHLLEADWEAIAELVRYSAGIAESRDHLSTQFALIGDLLREASYWANREGSRTIDQAAVLRAVSERNFVSSLTESTIYEEILHGEMMISLSGTKIGVVNGLAVLDRGAASFGTPTVISATVAPGTEGIVNIEHEAGLSGEIHDKGLLILEGYLRKRYARNFPLSMYSGICFEQSYAEIDGDSASSSELYALLSAIGEIPIRQDIAVTGSVNQMGEVQPVGGINEKITGFFGICRRLGLSGRQGVIIPIQNIRSLILPYDVLEAIKEGLFHIHPVESIDEGMQILSNRPAGVRNQKGNFPPDTFNRIIEDRLKHLYELSRPQN